MKNPATWSPSKFVYKKSKLVASRDTKEVGIASRLITDLSAQWYEAKLTEYASGCLLDLGCGKAPLYLVYSDLVDDCICVDWDSSFHTNPHLDYSCDLTKPLPFLNGEFQTVILSDVLEHIPEPWALWSEIDRLLAPGGVLLMNVPFYYSIHEEPYDYYRYTEYALRRFDEQSSLDLIELDVSGGLPEVIADISSKILAKLRPQFLFFPLASFLQWVVRRFVKTKVGARASSVSGKKFPFGYFLVAKKSSRES